MKKILLTSVTAFFALGLFAQHMGAKQPNFTSFSKNEVFVNRLLEKNTYAETKQHPEYGILPYNAQCVECVELIDKRTIDSRFYIDPKNEGHTYSQKSYFPLHYKKQASDVWRTIDPRLREVSNGIYEAKYQPVPTRCDLNWKTTTMDVGDMQFEFNKDLTVYFFDDATAYSAREKGNYTKYTIGDEGLKVNGMWHGIDMKQKFGTGEIETDYIINSPLQLPLNKGFMVIEDHFTLPAGFTFEEAGEEETRPGYEDFYQGDYLLKNAKGEVLLTYQKPVYVDSKYFGMRGYYKLAKAGNDYTLSMYVPVDWLRDPNTAYPVVIDPQVVGRTKMGDFVSTSRPVANLKFSSAPAACDYDLNVTVPGKSKLTKAYIDIEYELTYNPSCGSPPIPAPFCQFANVTQSVTCNSCNVNSGPLSCERGTGSPNLDKRCTTDPVAVPGASSIYINEMAPDFLSCIPPQCADYSLEFTLLNQDNICAQACDIKCAQGKIWEMTIEAQTVEGSITQDKTQICTGDSVTFTAHPDFGVPPYRYHWYVSNEGIDSTTPASPTYTIYPDTSVSVACMIFDSCNMLANTNGLNIAVPAKPGISNNGGMLISSYNSNNQWYRNDTLIDGATEKGYTPTTPGTYTVRVITNGCEVFSTPVIISPVGTGINEANKIASITIYPNPATTELTIKADNFQPQNIALFDVKGRKVMEQKFNAQIDISSLTAGVYFIEVKGKEVTARRRFVKE